MHYRIVLLSTLLLVVLSAFTAADAAAFKVGVVDFQAVVEGSEAGKKFEADMKKEGQQMEAEIQKGQEELKALKEKVERESAVMSEKAKEEKQIEFNVKLSGLQKKQAQYRKDFLTKQRQGVSKFRIEVIEIAHEIGKAEKYDLIISKDALLYLDSGVDITPKVIKALNKRHKKK